MELGAARIHEFARVEYAPELARNNIPDPDTIVRAVEQANGSEFVGPRNELTISFEPETKRPILKLVDRETQEVIRQFPAEYVLRLARNFARNRANSV